MRPDFWIGAVSVLDEAAKGSQETEVAESFLHEISSSNPELHFCSIEGVKGGGDAAWLGIEGVYVLDEAALAEAAHVRAHQQLTSPSFGCIKYAFEIMCLNFYL
jgi:hypothetical protein